MIGNCDGCNATGFTARVNTSGSFFNGSLRMCWECAGALDEYAFIQEHDDGTWVERIAQMRPPPELFRFAVRAFANWIDWRYLDTLEDDRMQYRHVEVRRCLTEPQWFELWHEKTPSFAQLNTHDVLAATHRELVRRRTLALLRGYKFVGGITNGPEEVVSQQADPERLQGAQRVEHGERDCERQPQQNRPASCQEEDDPARRGDHPEDPQMSRHFLLRLGVTVVGIATVGAGVVSHSGPVFCLGICMFVLPWLVGETF